MSDIYMHVPHGSNNRLNGDQADVYNAYRLFDSQVRSLFNSLILNDKLSSKLFKQFSATWAQGVGGGGELAEQNA